MTKEVIIEKTIRALTLLPADKAVEIADFAEYILKKYEEKNLQKGLEVLQSESNAFAFLNDEEDLYSPADIKQ
jgi:hypothetical protein